MIKTASLFMKKVVFLCLLTTACYGQIYLKSPISGGITITPNGLEGTNSGSNPYPGYNIALGWKALENNTFASGNLAIGYEALTSTIKGSDNVAIGFYAMRINSQGSRNVAVGHNAMNNNRGFENTAVGYGALSSNAGSDFNVAIGSFSLSKSTIGGSNTSIGYKAGFNSRTGSNNTFLGFMADIADTTLTNIVAIGANTVVNASNKIRLGNDQVTVIEGQVAYTYPSDRRLKENIQYTSQLGLKFINRLQTVSYSYISDKTHVRHDGFIAQDIEAVMKELNVSFSGLKKSPEGTYSLAYSDFIMPLVNAVKEQQTEINDLKEKLSRMEGLEKRLLVLEASLPIAPTGR